MFVLAYVTDEVHDALVVGEFQAEFFIFRWLIGFCFVAFVLLLCLLLRFSSALQGYVDIWVLAKFVSPKLPLSPSGTCPGLLSGLE